MASGEITEYRSRNPAPKPYKAGDILAEHGDVWHWWQGGDTPVILYAADLADVDGCQSGEC
ncbi:MAG: hypothetical protein ACFCBW_05240 [Candidatus Competibacterales bacterium]